MGGVARRVIRGKQCRAGALMSRGWGEIRALRQEAYFSIRKRSTLLRRLRFEPAEVGGSLKAPDFLGFRKAYQIAQVNSLGENRPSERGFPACRPLSGQQPRAENRRKPAPHGVAAVGGDGDSKSHWRRECDWGRTVSAFPEQKGAIEQKGL